MDKSLEVGTLVLGEHIETNTKKVGKIVGFSFLGTICYVEHEHPAKHVRSYFTSNVTEFKPE